MRLAICLLAAFAALSPASIFGATKNIAELFPADSLAYVEVCQPGATAKDLATFVKGSVLENPLPMLDKMRDGNGQNPLNISDAGVLIAMLGPEMLKESARFDGIAAALTGFGKHGDPEFAAVVLTGESQLPGFAMRTFLTSHPGLRKVGDSEGVGLYQKRANQFGVDPLLNSDVPPRGDSAAEGIVFGYAPGIIVAGSSPQQAAGVIRRWKEKEKSQSFAETKIFKQTTGMRQAPGIMVLADGKKLLTSFAGLLRDRKAPEPYLAVLLRQLLPAAGADVCTVKLEFKENGFDLHCSLGLDAKTKMPLAEILSGPGLVTADLQGLANDSPLSATLNLPAGAGRASALLDFLDRLVKANGSLGPTAGEIVQELQEKKVLTRESLGKVNGLSIAMPPIASWPARSQTLPTLIVRAESAESLELLEAALPAFLEILSSHKADPVTETIEGVKVHSLDAKTSPLAATLHYARRDRVLAIGVDRRFVAACVTADPARSLAKAPEIADMFNAANKPVLLGAWNWSATLAPRKTENANAKKSTLPQAPEGIAVNGQRPPSLPVVALQALQALPPLLVAVSYQNNELCLELRQRDPQRLRAGAIERCLTWYVKTRPINLYNGRPFDGNDIDGLVPFPPPFLPGAP
jgi:hypothetical protein